MKPGGVRRVRSNISENQIAGRGRGVDSKFCGETTIRAMSRLRAGAPSERHMAAEQYVIASQSVLAGPQTRLRLAAIRQME
jgi:hypothetical protein